MNDYKDNWFYQMCAKQGGKNIVYIVVGVLLFIAGILLFTAVISVLNVLLSLFGVLMILQGGKSLIFKMPKLKAQLQGMSREDFQSLGSSAPEPMYWSTFYFTERYLCAPGAYELIRYDSIGNISAYTVTVSGQKSLLVNIEFNNGRPGVDISVKDWGTFLKEKDRFNEMIEHYKNGPAL